MITTINMLLFGTECIFFK